MWSFSAKWRRSIACYPTSPTLDASDTVISIGSSGAVVNIDPIVEMTGALGILNVLDNVVGAIDEHVWDKRFYEPATLAVPAIDAIVRERMGLAASSEV